MVASAVSRLCVLRASIAENIGVCRPTILSFAECSEPHTLQTSHGAIEAVPNCFEIVTICVTFAAFRTGKAPAQCPNWRERFPTYRKTNTLDPKTVCSSVQMTQDKDDSIPPPAPKWQQIFPTSSHPKFFQDQLEVKLFIVFKLVCKFAEGKQENLDKSFANRYLSIS